MCSPKTTISTPAILLKRFRLDFKRSPAEEAVAPKRTKIKLKPKIKKIVLIVTFRMTVPRAWLVSS